MTPALPSPPPNPMPSIHTTAPLAQKAYTMKKLVNVTEIDPPYPPTVETDQEMTR